jgi:hypothetical protein
VGVRIQLCHIFVVHVGQFVDKNSRSSINPMWRQVDVNAAQAYNSFEDIPKQ